MDWKEALFNVGAFSSYVQMAIFAARGAHIIASGEKPDWSIVYILMSILAGTALSAPYKWDKRSMRFKSISGLIVYSIVLTLYIYALLRNNKPYRPPAEEHMGGESQSHLPQRDSCLSSNDH